MPAACTTQAPASPRLFLFLFFSCLSLLLHAGSLNFLQITSSPCLPLIVKGLVSEMWDAWVKADGMRLLLLCAGRQQLTSAD